MCVSLDQSRLDITNAWTTAPGSSLELNQNGVYNFVNSRQVLPRCHGVSIYPPYIDQGWFLACTQSTPGHGVPIYIPGLILGLRPANERRRYKVTPSLIGWAQTLNQPWRCYFCDDGRGVTPSPVGHSLARWLSARLQLLQCIGNGDTAVLY